MGMFDYVMGEITCPKCGNKFMAEEQIKWTNDCFLNTYNVGDDIDACDGEYDYGSLVRPRLISECPECKKTVKFKVIVECGKVKNIEAYGYGNSYREVLKELN